MLPLTDRTKRKMHSAQRLIKLEPIDEKKAAKSLIDPKLYKGGNTIRMIKDKSNGIWYFKYEHGGLPPALKDQRFTRYDDALKFVSAYFEKSGFKVTAVEDHWVEDDASSNA